MRYLLVLAKLDPEKKRTYAAIASATGLELAVSERVEAALAWLEGHDPKVVAFDTTVVAGEKLCQKIRSRKKLSSVPLIAMVSDTSDTFVERLYNLGADDVIEGESGAALIARLRALPGKEELTPADRGIAIVADKDNGRCDVLGRVLMNAGYEVKFAHDDIALRFYTQQSKVRLVVASAELGSPRKLIEDARRSGNLTPWLVTAPRRDLMKHAGALEGLEQVTIVASTTAPENVLFTSNELLREGGPPARSEERTLFGTVAGFKPAGAESDDLGFSYNISPGGIYVRTLAAPTEERVWVELRPPRAKRRVRLEGRIAWRRSYDPAAAATAPPGFGLQIIDGLGDSLEVWKAHCELYVRTTRAVPATLNSVVTSNEEPGSERTSDSKIAVVNVSARRPAIPPRPPPRMFPAERAPEASRTPPTLESNAGPLEKEAEPGELRALETEWETLSSADLKFESTKPPPPSPPEPPPPPSRPEHPPVSRPEAPPLPPRPVIAVGGPPLHRKPPPKPVREQPSFQPVAPEVRHDPLAGSPPAEPMPLERRVEPVPLEQRVEPMPLERRAEPEPIELRRVVSSPPEALPAPEPGAMPPSLPIQRAPRTYEEDPVIEIGQPSRFGLLYWLFGGALLGGVAGAIWIWATPRTPLRTRPQSEPSTRSVPGAAASASAEPASVDAGAMDAGLDAADARLEASPAMAGDAALATATDAGAPAAEAGVALELPAIEEGDGGAGSELGVTLGYLVVRSTTTLDVWASGVKLGPTNKKNQAACGLRFVRLGKGDNPPSWLTDGRTVDVKCQAITIVNQEPKTTPVR